MHGETMKYVIHCCDLFCNSGYANAAQ